MALRGVRKKVWQAAYNLKSRYGITYAERNEMLERQGGRCAICTDVLYRPCVDHDHVTGMVRGLLCSSCNVGIGQLKEAPHVLRAAAHYLETRT